MLSFIDNWTLKNRKWEGSVSDCASREVNPPPPHPTLSEWTVAVHIKCMWLVALALVNVQMFGLVIWMCHFSATRLIYDKVLKHFFR